MQLRIAPELSEHYLLNPHINDHPMKIVPLLFNKISRPEAEIFSDKTEKV